MIRPLAKYIAKNRMPDRRCAARGHPIERGARIYYWPPLGYLCQTCWDKLCEAKP
jgi:hypothetical protein